ncbi:hypothetical protein [Treponema pedis]|uniref:hypothetical protein n=1 Tax=Treponema pedis TaxID=409322 RepID=UPI0031340C9B
MRNDAVLSVGVLRGALKGLARNVFNVTKTYMSFKEWYELGFDDCMQEALNTIDTGCCSFETGSSFEISRFQSRDGKTHTFNVDKEDLIEWFGDWLIDAYAPHNKDDEDEE